MSGRSKLEEAVSHRLPNISSNGVPFCSSDACPQYDGKRCQELGLVVRGICEPAVIDLHAELVTFWVETRTEDQALWEDRCGWEARQLLNRLGEVARDKAVEAKPLKLIKGAS